MRLLLLQLAASHAGDLRGTHMRRRHGALPGYKASRRSVPSEFRPDLRNTQLLLRFMRVPMLSVPGYEADDVLAGVARQASRDGQWAVRIVSTDQDLFQV